MTEWNKAQLRVLESLNEDKNILVSAAAGSGKTAVLVERIIRSVMENKCDIDELLVVTFTRAAAAQMKAKVIKALEDVCEKGEDPSMVKQLALAENADITTIDSFCNRVVRDNFSLIGIDPAYDFYDAQEAKMLHEDILDDCFNEWYETDEEFKRLASLFMKKGMDDTKLRDAIFQIYRVSQSHADERGFFDGMRKEAEASGDEVRKLPWLVSVVDEAERFFTDAKLRLEKLREDYLPLKGLENDKLVSNLIDTISFDIDNVSGFLDAKSMEEMRLAASAKLKTFSKKNACIEAFGKDIENYASLRENIKLFFQTIPDIGEIIKEQDRNRWMTLKMIECTEVFAERLLAEKRRNRKYEFGDIAHFAYKVLRDEETGCLTPAAVELRDRYRYIYIDEYQDSNDLQEEILNSVARRDDKGNPCNVFMVGDVKQSIYRFRLAKPALFMEKSANYAEEDGDGILLNLNTNYRSRKEILEATNFIFRNLMIKEVGGIEYDDEARLNAPEKKNDAEGEEEERRILPEILLLNTKTDDGASDEDAEEGSESGASLSSLDLMNGDEAEAIMIGKRILELVDDSKDSGLGRKVNFGDITILMRTVSGAEPMIDILTGMGIPVKLDSKSGYFDASEIMTLLAVLSVIDNSRQDIPYVSVLLSEIGGFTEPELALIVTRRPLRRRYMYDMCVDFANAYRDAEDDALRKTAVKLDLVNGLIEKWKAVKSYISIAELIDRILEDTEYDVFVSSMPEGDIRLANVRMLRYRAESFEKSGFTSLFEFMRYIEKCKIHDIDFGKAEAASDAGNVVHVTTIHSSKGLEYPVVILARTAHNFNTNDLNSAVMVDSELGIAHDSYEVMENGICMSRKGIRKEIFRRIQMKEMIAEEMRLLYVAMTRAKEKLIITGNTNTTDYSKLSYNYETIISKCHALLKMLLPAVNCDGFENFFELKTMNKTEVISEYTGIKEGKRASKPEEAYARLKSKVLEIEADKPDIAVNPYNYTYPYLAAVSAPSKAAVSGIERAYTIKLEEEGKIPRRITLDPKAVEAELAQATDEEVAEPDEERFDDRDPVEEKKKDIYPGTRRGTVIHKIMELLDYSKINSLSDMDAEIDRIIEKNFFTDEDRAHLRRDMVLGFYSDDETSLFRRMKKAAERGMLYREKSFLMGMKPSEIPGLGYSEENFGDDMITVQGIVDAFFYEIGEDGQKYVTLIDYKTDRVKEATELIDRYSVQLELYALSLSRITDAKINGIIFYCFAQQQEVDCPVKLSDI